MWFGVGILEGRKRVCFFCKKIVVVLIFGCWWWWRGRDSESIGRSNVEGGVEM